MIYHLTHKLSYSIVLDIESLLKSVLYLYSVSIVKHLLLC